MYRVAIYARERDGSRPAGRRRLERQIGGLVTVVARHPGWVHVATYADHDTAPAGVRPGLARFLAEAPGRVDMVVVDDYVRLSADHRVLDGLLEYLDALGVRTAVLRPSPARRFAKVAANLALADLVGEAAG